MIRGRGPSFLLFAVIAHLTLVLVGSFVPSPQRRVATSSLGSTATDNEEQRESLLKKASKLRQEASELESALTGSRRPKETSSTVPAAVVCKTLPDSVWTFSYRFSDQPESRDKEKEEDDSKRVFYSGKLTLRLREDGYSEIISHEPRAPGNTLDVLKAWGWDVEVSNEDQNDYLLFSVDMNVPSNEGARKERFYFQARQESDDAGISLKEGTVTIKQDVVDSKRSPALWGLFPPRGILAEFRYVGDFVAKPSRAE